MSFKYSIVSFCAAAFFFGIVVLTNAFFYFADEIPSYYQLTQHPPATITRIIAAKDMSLLAEYGNERRIFTKIKNIPEIVIQAFLSAEDKNFFKHTGFDTMSIIRAVIQNFRNIKSSKRLVGGSTITQQVVKSFLLDRSQTARRKLIEMILAYRISKIYSKQQILELYLNKIFLGQGSYGAAAAAVVYFNKDLKDLLPEEAALLASLPKAPSGINPFVNYERAKERRDWVLFRMYKDGVIAKETYVKSIETPILLTESASNKKTTKHFSYIDAVRRELVSKYGQEVLETSGMVVLTNIEPQMQDLAQETLNNHLIEYQTQKSFLSKIDNISLQEESWLEKFQDMQIAIAKPPYYLGIITKIDKSKYHLLLQNNQKKIALRKPSIKLQQGDVVLVKIEQNLKHQQCILKNVPKANGAIIIIENYTGKILASVGGVSNNTDVFNRVIQAKRQPGSLFKTIVYLSALENGYDINTILNDAPISLKMSNGKIWQPKNLTNRFLGPIPMIQAFARSANLATIRLVMALGFKEILDTAHRLNIYQNISYKDTNLSMALGTAESTLFTFSSIFTSIASSGLKIRPRYIDSIFSHDGNIIYSDNTLKSRPYPTKQANQNLSQLDSKSSEDTASSNGPKLYYVKKRLIDKEINTEMVKMLRAVVQSGSGFAAREIDKDLILKTGTTNDSKDVWCVGSSEYFTIGIYLGYDIPKDMGKDITGTKLAVPVFVDLMKKIKYIGDNQVSSEDTRYPILEENNQKLTPTLQNVEIQEMNDEVSIENLDDLYANILDSYLNDSDLYQADDDSSGAKPNDQLVGDRDPAQEQKNDEYRNDKYSNNSFNHES